MAAERIRGVGAFHAKAWMIEQHGSVSLPLGPGVRGGALDRFANAHIGSAAANIAGHGVVDIAVARMRIAGDERASPT